MCTDGLGTYIPCSNHWTDWARWLVLTLLVLTFLFLMFACSRLSARRRKAAGLRPYFGTGWTLGNYVYSTTPYAHAAGGRARAGHGSIGYVYAPARVRRSGRSYRIARGAPASVHDAPVTNARFYRGVDEFGFYHPALQPPGPPAPPYTERPEPGTVVVGAGVGERREGGVQDGFDIPVRPEGAHVREGKE